MYTYFPSDFNELLTIAAIIIFFSQLMISTFFIFLPPESGILAQGGLERPDLTSGRLLAI